MLHDYHCDNTFTVYSHIHCKEKATGMKTHTECCAFTVLQCHAHGLSHQLATKMYTISFSGLYSK